MGSFEIEIAAIEDDRIQAKITGDVERLADLLDERLVYGHGSGEADTKATYLAKIRTGLAIYHAGRSTITRMITLGDTALVFTRVEMDASIMGTPRKIDNAVLLVWVRSDTSWRLIAHQPTVNPVALNGT